MDGFYRLYYSNIRRNTHRTFKEKKCGYMKVIVNKPKENIKNKNICKIYKGINEFKNAYQPHIYTIEKMVKL